jgi:recombination protein RecA
MFINQLRMKLGITFGSPETTTGGHALKYYASVRLDIRRIGPVKNGEEVCGNRTRVKVVKNKLAPPFQITEFDIRYGTGIDALGDLLDKAVEREVVKKSGAYYAHEGTSLGQGRERAREALTADPELCERIRQRVLLTASTPALSAVASSSELESTNGAAAA